MILTLRLSDAPPGPPLDPTAQHARDQLLAELSKAEYQAARPSGFDVLVQQVEQAIAHWLDGLFGQTGAAIDPSTIVGVLVVIGIAALVVLFLVFGLPRINHRSSGVGFLFGEDDGRTSTLLRQDAERAAAARDFTTAIVEEFRSIARGMAERSVVTTFPGTTASGFAARAGEAFPDYDSGLRESARTFDGVRYLGAVGTEQQWLDLRTLELELRQARPYFEPESVDAQ